MKSGHLECDGPLVSLSLHLRGWVATNGRDIVKSQPLFDVHRQYLQTLLIDLQAALLRFRCRIFLFFAYFFKI